MKAKDYVRLALSIALCEGVGVIDSVFTAPSVTGWYSSLPKPFFNPPNWIFAPTWTLLYLLMGIALFLIWRTPTKSVSGFLTKRKAVWIFVFQLFLNVLWTIFFFGFENAGAAFFEIIALWFAIIWTIMGFRKISGPAVILLLPYIAWITFAAILNYAIWMTAWIG